MREQKILSNWKELLISIDELYKENKKTLGKNFRLYTKLLENFPHVTLVDDDARDEEALIQGVLHLFTDLEYQFLSSKEKKNKTLCFTFFIDRSVIKRGWFDGKELFSGDWLTGLEFILNEVVKMPIKEDLNPSQQKAIEVLIQELAKK
jgi:hypothetical protein